MIGESRSERRTRRDQRDDRRRAMCQYAELDGEAMEYLDEFTFDERDLARRHWLAGRVPKCLMKGCPCCGRVLNKCELCGGQTHFKICRTCRRKEK